MSMKLIFTGDIVTVLTRRYSIPLYLGMEERLDNLEIDFLSTVAKRIFPDYDSIVVCNDKISDLYEKNLEKENLPIISIDDLWERKGINYFQINRMLNTVTEKTFLDSRSGFPSLEDQ